MANLHRAQAAIQEVIQSRQVGNWELTEPLGRGGFGTTWMAVKKEADKSFTQVAVVGGAGRLKRAVIKLMLPPAPEDLGLPLEKFDAWLDKEAKGFHFEAIMLSKVPSEYIPGVHDAGMEPTNAGWDVPWFAMERISGRSLAEQIGNNGPLDQNQLLELAHDILSALAAIHHAGLVHLDLKPENVMLEPHRARLIDFGLVTKANRVGRLGMTRGFEAPEQLDEIVEERDFAPAVDVYKLGVTLAIAAGTRMPDLWGVDPYGDEEVVRRAIKNGPRLTHLSTTLRRVVEPMLAFDPRQRPTAAAALHQVRDLIPTGSAKGSGKAVGAAKSDPIPQPAQQSARATAGANSSRAATPRPPQVAPKAPASPAVGNGRANIGAKVVVVDRLGLDWIGVVVDLDSKRPGNILVRHDSARGNANIRSYPLNQVVRGRPLK